MTTDLRACRRAKRCLRRWFTQLSDLGMQHRQVHRWTLTVAATLRAKQSGCPVEKLRLPLSDLVGMNVKLLCQLGQRLLALDSSQSHLRLESRCVVPAGSFRHCLVRWFCRPE